MPCQRADPALLEAGLVLYQTLFGGMLVKIFHKIIALFDSPPFQLDIPDYELCANTQNFPVQVVPLRFHTD
jgi:hypothetical protein